MPNAIIIHARSIASTVDGTLENVEAGYANVPINPRNDSVIPMTSIL